MYIYIHTQKGMEREGNDGDDDKKQVVPTNLQWRMWMTTRSMLSFRAIENFSICTVVPRI